MIRSRLVAAIVMGAAAVTALPPAPAAARPTHIAVVVAGAGTACVAAGGTGLDALSRGFRVTYGQRAPYLGFVLQINEVGALTPDNTHYWSYWHHTISGWQYSSNGGGGYTPPAGSVEGWSYVDDSSTAMPPPPASYAAICAGQDAPDPTPTPTTSAGPNPPPAARSMPTPMRAEATTTTPTATTAGDRTASEGITTPSTIPASSPVSDAATSRVTPSQEAVPTTSLAAERVEPGGADDGPPWGTVLGLAVAGLLGGAAVWWSRRRTRP